MLGIVVGDGEGSEEDGQHPCLLSLPCREGGNRHAVGHVGICAKEKSRAGRGLTLWKFGGGRGEACCVIYMGGKGSESMSGSLRPRQRERGEKGRAMRCASSSAR